MPHITRRTALLALAPAIAGYSTCPARAAEPPRQPTPALTGTYALPDGKPKVAATLTATPKVGGEAGTQVLDVAMTQLGTGRAVTRFETELSKQLHLIAVSGDLRTFVHEHADKPDARGRFRVTMPFPRGGLWHVYADAVPAGLGQQVMRFDLMVPGDTGNAAPGSPPTSMPQPTGLESTDGRYGVRFDTMDLRAGQELGRTPMRVCRTTLALGLALACWCAAPSHAADPAPADVAAPRPAADAGIVVRRPGRGMTLTAAALAELPTVRVSIPAGNAPGARGQLFEGPLLWTVLAHAGAVDTVKHQGGVRGAVLLAGRDGYIAILALGELSPEFEGKQVILALRVDGQPLGPGNLRVVVPGDKRGGRGVHDLVQIRVEQAFLPPQHAVR